MEYSGLVVIIIIITLLWFVKYQNHCQKQKIEKLNKKLNELILALRKGIQTIYTQKMTFN